MRIRGSAERIKAWAANQIKDPLPEGDVEFHLHKLHSALGTGKRAVVPYQPAGTAPFKITIVYEDDAMAIVHKPRGVCSHPTPGGTDGNMTMRLCVPYWVKGAPAGSVGVLWRPMLVHRLDKETEGLQVVAKTKPAMVVAKTKPALIELQRQFAARLVGKRYLALVEGYVAGEEGEIDFPIEGREAVSR
ncbi:pseudouridine synthase [Baffinella frigidus]|nr:pseudouridine synthase [Cryptophyta sp. CCMP2293]